MHYFFFIVLSFIVTRIIIISCQADCTDSCAEFLCSFVQFSIKSVSFLFFNKELCIVCQKLPAIRRILNISSKHHGLHLDQLLYRRQHAVHRPCVLVNQFYAFSSTWVSPVFSSASEVCLCHCEWEWQHGTLGQLSDQQHGLLCSHTIWNYHQSLHGTTNDRKIMTR